MNEWHPHNPGDPMPVDGETEVFVRRRDGYETKYPSPGSSWSWGKFADNDITAYRYANPADDPEATPRAIQVGDTVEHINLEGRGTVLAIAGSRAAVLWDDGLDAHFIHWLTPAKPADKPQPAPERRWIPVEEQPHPTDGKTRFWMRLKDGEVGITKHGAKNSFIAAWCPLLEQPPEFVKPLTDAEKLAIAVEALRKCANNTTPAYWMVAQQALAKIRSAK